MADPRKTDTQSEDWARDTARSPDDPSGGARSPGDAPEAWVAASAKNPDDIGDEPTTKGGRAMQVQEVMHRQVDLIDPDSLLSDAARRMRQDNVGALPVGENDRLVGMITDRDIVVRAIADDKEAGKTPVRQVMAEGVYYCFGDASLDEAAKVMAEHQVHRLPVLNHDKRMVGILAVADLARAGGEGADAAKTAICGISEPTQAPRR